MHTFHPNYMFNANEVTDEYNLLNDFLSTSLFEETGMYSTEEFQGPFNDPSFMNSIAASSLTLPPHEPLMPPEQQNDGQIPVQNNAAQAAMISRPSSVKPVSDKAREKYYMMAADPTGAEPPEERMQKLLKAKYDAGMLRPFNYVNGYARLNKYMEKNMKQSSRHKILMQLDQFRPKFRERMQSLTDIELVLVEMWFERSLMEYDRIFASMAIPACCWRRTGEIFRGNKEMAELIHVPIESLRDVSTRTPRAISPLTNLCCRANLPFTRSLSKINWSVTGKSSVRFASISSKRRCLQAVRYGVRMAFKGRRYLAVFHLRFEETITTCEFTIRVDFFFFVLTISDHH